MVFVVTKLRKLKLYGCQKLALVCLVALLILLTVRDGYYNDPDRLYFFTAHSLQEMRGSDQQQQEQKQQQQQQQQQEQPPQTSTSFPHAGFCVSDCLVSGHNIPRNPWDYATAVMDGYDPNNRQPQRDQPIVNTKSTAVWKRITTLSSTLTSGSQPFDMLLTDPRKDKFISGTLQGGGIWHKDLVRVLDKFVCQKAKLNQNTVFVDVGANIGWFSFVALACGVQHVIAFEPFRGNMALLMHTIQANPGWKERSTLFMNTVSFDSSRTYMKSTNTDINVSNMAVQGSECSSADTGTVIPGEYGVDYMESVSLDQVFLTTPQLRHVQRVNLMKIDVEMFEIHVLDGAMRFLCNRVVEAFLVEVEYLKDPTKLANSCNFDRLLDQLTAIGYTPYNPGKYSQPTDSLVGLALKQWSGDALFILSDTSVPPGERLKTNPSNPCRDFLYK